MYCRKPNGVLTNLSSGSYNNCASVRLNGTRVCGGWRYFLANCPRTNAMCSSISGAWVAAITVCNQQLFTSYIPPSPPDIGPPGLPLNLLVTSPTTANINMSWDPPSNNGGQSVDTYATEIYFNSSLIYGDEDSTGTSYVGTNSELNLLDYAGQECEFRVSACHGFSGDVDYLCGDPAIYSFTPTFAAPSAPLNFSAEPDMAEQRILFSWDAPNNDGGKTITEYQIGSQTQDLNPIGNGNTSAYGSYSDLGLSDGQEETFSISAYNGINGPSASVTITLPS